MTSTFWKALNTSLAILLTMGFLAACDQPDTPAERVGNAVEEAGDDIGDAFDTNDTPAEKMGENLEEAGDELD